MNSLRPKEPLILFLGDIFFLMVTLWISLALRNFTLPSKALFLTHLTPFGFLFIIWIAVFYIAGLYEKRTLILRSKLPGVLFNTQIANSIIAVIFFYFIPYFGITPKTLLFIYLLISFLVILFWRVYGYFLIGARNANKALIIGSGPEMKELYDEVNSHPLYNLKFISSVDLDADTGPGFLDEILSRVYSEEVSLIAVDLANPKSEPVLPRLYNLIFSKISFVDMHKIYEDIFDRVPLSLLKYNWFLENISTSPTVAYDALKRIMDFILGVLLLILSIPFDIFAVIAIKLEGGGPVFVVQDRVGQNNKLIRIIKFRTMSGSDHGEYNKEGKSELRVTRVGNFLRKSRIDEFPQFWNVITGDLSLVGPRPELPKLMKVYEKEIPYYNVRHIIKPGLSGWAQIYQENHPHHGEAVMETKEKLAYDLYYIKNRSLLLDFKIALRTIRTLLSRAGK
ncbi:MAG: sugar transferase [Parcubacteria group bacterium]|nr:sugar transferase [Parcubacteria group bacterium]